VLPLSTGGPMGRNTSDTIQLLNTMLPNSIAGDFTPLLLGEVKIAWMGDLDGYLAMESGILPLCESALTTVSDAGARVEETQSQFDLNELWECWTTLRHSGRVSMSSYYNNPETKAQLKPELIWEIEQGMSLTEADIARANAIRERWYVELERLFAEYDFVVLPTAQVFPFSKDVHWPKYIGLQQMDTYHRWMEVVIPGSLGALPVINVPVGFDAGGRPMGMQIMGRRGDDKRVLEFGLAYEQLTSFLARRPALV
jgi:amidase